MEEIQCKIQLEDCKVNKENIKFSVPIVYVKYVAVFHYFQDNVPYGHTCELTTFSIVMFLHKKK